MILGTGLISSNGNFMDLTNNRLYNLNDKLNSEILVFSNFETFVEKMLKIRKVYKCTFD